MMQELLLLVYLPEEELTNMIRFQSAYNASSRYVTTVADMLEYLIEKLGA